jgi:putative ABC transport system permease protein
MEAMFNNENRFLFHFAGKSIKRNAGRSFFIGLSVSVAVIIAIWILAFFEGINHQIEKSVVNTNLGFFQLQEKEFSRISDPSHPLEFDDKLRVLLDDPNLQASPELVLDGNITAPEGSAALLILGVSPELHKKFLPVSENLTEGSFLTSDDKDSVVIGEELARIFKLKVGEQIVLNFQDHTGQLRSELLSVKGIFHFSSNSFEKRFIYINQSTWQRLYLNKDTGKILFNRIAMMAPSLDQKEKVQEKTDQTSLILKTWRDLNPEMSVVIEFNNSMIRMFFIIIALTVLMTILTPVQMLWQERFKELKMLNTLGVANKRFWKIGFFEVLHMIFYSGIASTIIATVIIGIQTQTGVLFDYGQKGVNIERAGIKLTGVVYPVLAAHQITLTFLFVIFVLSVSYAWSIFRVIKKLEAQT